MKFNRFVLLMSAVFFAGMLTTSCYTQLAVAKHHDVYYEDEYADQAQDSVYYDEGTTVNNYYYGRPDRFLIRHGMIYDDSFYWDDFYFSGSFYFGDYYDYPYWYDPFLYYPGVVVGIYYPPYYRYYDPWWNAPPVVYSPPFKHRPFRQNGRTIENGDTRRVSLNGRGASSVANNGSRVSRTAVRRSDRTDDNWGSGNLVTKRTGVRSSNSGNSVTVSSRRTTVRGKDNSVVRVKRGDYQRQNVRRSVKKDGAFRRNKVKKNRRVYYPVRSTQPVKRMRPAKTQKERVRSVSTPKHPKESSKSGRSRSVKRSESPSSSNSGSSYRPAPSRNTSFRSTPSRSSSFSGSRSSSSHRSSSHRSSRTSSRRR